jgi:hypothetical protein
MAKPKAEKAPVCTLCGRECQPTDNGKLRCPVPNHDTYVKDGTEWVRTP